MLVPTQYPKGNKNFRVRFLKFILALSAFHKGGASFAFECKKMQKVPSAPSIDNFHCWQDLLQVLN